MIAATDGKTIYPANGAAPRDSGLKLTGKGHLLGRVLDMAAQHKIKQLWLMPGSAVHKRIAKLKATPPTEKTGWTIKPDTVRNILTGWREGEKRIQIVGPGLKDQQWKLDTVSDVGLWREVLEILINYTGVAPSIPIRTARLIVESTINKSWLVKPMDLGPFLKHVDHDLSFRRMPNRAEESFEWLHCYDKKQMYLSAWGCPLGVGETHEVKPDAFNPKQAGLWEVEVCKPVYGANGPKWNVLLGDEKYFRGVLYTPVLAFLQSRGATIKVHRALWYEYQHRVFEPTYNKLRRAFSMIPDDGKYSADARAVAVKCLKACYVQFIGWMGHDPGARPERFFRPDWRSTIIAEAKARVAHNIQKCFELSGMRPVGVRVDSVLYLSNDADPQRAAPPPFTGTGAAYKVKYSVPAKAAMALLTDGSKSIQQIDDQLFKESQNDSSSKTPTRRRGARASGDTVRETAGKAAGGSGG